jgi:hypothetical protein
MSATTTAFKRALRSASSTAIGVLVFCLVWLAALVMGDPTEH